MLSTSCSLVSSPPAMTVRRISSGTSVVKKVRISSRNARSSSDSSSLIQWPPRLVRSLHHGGSPLIEVRAGPRGGRIDPRGTRGRRRGALRAAGRPGAARGRVVPGGGGRQGRAGRRQRRRQDHAAAHHHRRPGAARGRRHPLRRARRDAADGRRTGSATAPTVADLLLSVAPPRVAGRPRRGRPARAGADGARRREDPARLRRARWPSTPTPAATTSRSPGTSARSPALGVPYDRAKYRELRTLSGGEQKRLVLEYLLRGPDEVLLLDEPDNFLDVPGKIWLEQRIRESEKTILFISHDRELLDNTATRVVTVELGARGQPGVDPPGRLRVATTRPARTGSCASRSCAGAGTRSTPRSRRWCCRMKIKAEYNDGMASQYKAAQTRLRKFEEAGPPTEQPREQQVKMRLKGGRTGKRAVVCEGLELTGLMQPFDLEVWYGERVAVLGSNGSGKSHFLRLLAAGGSDPDVEHRPVDDVPIEPVRHTREGQARRPRAARLVRADPRAPRAGRAHPAGDPAPRRRPSRRSHGDGPRAGGPRPGPLRARPRRRAEVRVAQRRPAGTVPDPAAGAVRRDRCCCSTSPPTTSTSRAPRRSRPASRPSRAPCSR